MSDRANYLFRIKIPEDPGSAEEKALYMTPFFPLSPNLPLKYTADGISIP
jgi:hypothetical protein